MTISFRRSYNEATENPDESDEIASNCVRKREKGRKEERNASLLSKPIDKISCGCTMLRIYHRIGFSSFIDRILLDNFFPLANYVAPRIRERELLKFIAT